MMIRALLAITLGLGMLTGTPLAAQTLGIACFDEDEQGRRSNYEPIAIGTPIVIDLAQDDEVILQDGTRIDLDTALTARLRVDPGNGSTYRVSGTLSCLSPDGGFADLALDQVIPSDGSFHVRQDGWRAAITITGLPPSM